VPEARVAVADVIAGTGFSTLIEAEPEVEGAATLTAVIVTGSTVGIAAGGVYTPELVIVPTLLFPPATVSTCHVTAVFVVFATAAVKVAVLPNRTWPAPLTLTVTAGCGGLFPPDPASVLLEHPLASMAIAKRDTVANRTWQSRESRTKDLRNACNPSLETGSCCMDIYLSKPQLRD